MVEYGVMVRFGVHVWNCMVWYGEVWYGLV